MSWKLLRTWLEYLGFRGGACILQMLSARQTAGLARGVAWVVVDVLPRKWTRYDVAYENIARAFGVRDGTDQAGSGVADAAKRQAAEPGSQISDLRSQISNNSQLSTLNTQPSTRHSPLTPGQIHEMIRGMWVHLVRLVAEVVQLPRQMTLANCREIVVFRNRQIVVQAFCTGRPVIVLGGHFGNWEVSTATFGLFGMPMGIVGRTLDNRLLDAWFAKARQATGHRLIDKRGAAPEMVAMMEAGGNLGLLCDQDAGRKGLFVDFFGRPASTFKSIALMALQYNAIIVVGYGIRLQDDFINSRWARFEIGCEDVIDPLTVDAADPIREITQRFTSALERAVRRAPEQYFWVHRRWKSEPRATAKLKKAA
ncbi:MAG: lysophospholipid acyltransferase family protein [Planctomycetaceae bacterium]